MWELNMCTDENRGFYLIQLILAPMGHFILSHLTRSTIIIIYKGMEERQQGRGLKQKKKGLRLKVGNKWL